LHIHANRIRSIGKESHNLEENLYGIEEPEYLEYVNIAEFSVWVLSLKPIYVKEKGISERGLERVKQKIGNNKKLNPKTVKLLLKLFSENKNQ
jgi:hypothetical protein